ncbi:IscS subfamily cysteine desulfurase [Heyndrickxia sp. NPDC080065]|uniref:IscS subfamily cysteine desulfurase n=1 Tax=Heyndrickxia sp. NPDC080065 TaxID=3390568 RepID=UPI003D0940E5
MIYFDYSATTPIDHEALEVYYQLSTQAYGNTNSLHDIGTKAENILQLCRNELADILTVPMASIYFTSGGTESNLLSIISLAKTQEHHGKHIITSMGEHSSVHSAMKYLMDNGFEISEIAFNQDGIVDLELLQKNIREDTILVSVQHVNSEIGTIQPIREIANLVQDRGILFHCDCVQSFGKLELTSIIPYIDCLTVSSHKIYGPKGVGAVYINPSVYVNPVFPGFHHEQGFRGGTINLPGIASFVTAAKKESQHGNQLEHYSTLRKIFLDELALKQDKFTIYQSFDLQKQLPHIIGLGLNGIEGQYVMLECNRNGFAISTGSACHVGQQKPSNTMNALGIPYNKAKEFIRISMGKNTTTTDLKALAAFLNNLTNY